MLSFVVAVRENNTEAAIMRSYKHPKAAESLYNECKVWQACRATSAATTFFDPITIGNKGQKFIDGGVLYNNPVRLIHQEAAALWPDQESLIISIGTGEAPGMAFKGNIMKIVQGLQKIATETDRTANDFFIDHKDMVDDRRYFRFNVTKGLGHIGLEEWKQMSAMADATETYLDHGEVRKKFDECVDRIRQTETEGMQQPFSRTDIGAGSGRLLEARPPSEPETRLLLEAPVASPYATFDVERGDLQPVKSSHLQPRSV